MHFGFQLPVFNTTMLIKYISQAYNILNLEVLDDHHDTSFAIVIIKILSRNLQNFSVIVIGA